MWDLSFLTRDQTGNPCVGVLTTGPLACACAKSLQSGLTLYHPKDGSPPVSVPKFLDFLTLECKPCKDRNIIGLPTKVPGTQ